MNRGDVSRERRWMRVMYRAPRRDLLPINPNILPPPRHWLRLNVAAMITSFSILLR